VDYEVKTQVQEVSSRVETLMKDSNSRSDFENTFRTELQEKEASSGRSIVIDEVQADEVKVAVTQKVFVVEATAVGATTTASISSSTAPTSKPLFFGSDGSQTEKDMSIIPPLPSTSSLPDDKAESSTSLKADSMTTTTTYSIYKWDDVPSAAVGSTPQLLIALVLIWLGPKVTL